MSKALKSNPKPVANLDRIFKKSLRCSPLDYSEIGTLLNLKDKKALNELFSVSGKLKERVFGKRVVLFAPLYLSNKCINNCLYCGFRRENEFANRKTLNKKEIVAEARKLVDMGHKRVLLVCAEHPKYSSPEKLSQAVKAIYKDADIRIVHINCAPFDIKGFKTLKDSGVGVYQLFQETYHLPTYEKVHPDYQKADYKWRLFAMDRAIKGGFKDVGLGVLFGLHDYRFETLSLIMHANYLQRKYKLSAHTISVPRLRPAVGAILNRAPYPVNDLDVKKIVSVLRLSLPYIGIVISTRESASLRDELVKIGASQISAASRTSPGGYDVSREESDKSQFSIEDVRSLDKVVKAILKEGNIPSFCCACYRSGRTGENFLNLAKECRIKDYCNPNIALTFKEYLIDYAKSSTRKLGEKKLNEYLDSLSLNGAKERLLCSLEEVENGKRDIYF